MNITSENISIGQLQRFRSNRVLGISLRHVQNLEAPPAGESRVPELSAGYGANQWLRKTILQCATNVSATRARASALVSANKIGRWNGIDGGLRRAAAAAQVTLFAADAHTSPLRGWAKCKNVSGQILEWFFECAMSPRAARRMKRFRFAVCVFRARTGAAYRIPDFPINNVAFSAGGKAFAHRARRRQRCGKSASDMLDLSNCASASLPVSLLPLEIAVVSGNARLSIFHGKPLAANCQYKGGIPVAPGNVPLPMKL